MKKQRWIGVCLLFVGLAATAAILRVGANEGPRTVVVSAKRFEFSPKEITLKKGEPVKLQLTTDDVTHGFLQKALGIDATIKPGETAEVVLVPQTAGRFTTICDHFCGAGHGNMKMTIVVE